MIRTRMTIRLLWILPWIWALFVPASAELVDVTLDLGPPSSSQNRLNLSITIPLFGSQSDTTDASGTMPVQLDMVFDPMTHAAQVQGLRFIEQTPGSIIMSDMSFNWPFSVFRVNSSSIRATGKSPDGSQAVIGGSFATEQHRVVLNSGVFSTSGLITTNINFSTEAIETTTIATGSVTVSAPIMDQGLATYTVALALPMDFDVTITDDPLVTVAGTGIIKGSAQFVHPVDDGDGIPRDWELAHSLDPAENDGGDDDDLDQVTNFEEYLADTDPQDPNSLLTCEFTVLSPTVGQMRFPARASRVYSIQGSVRIDAANWLTLDPNVPGQDGWITRTFNLFTLHYFRVRAQLP